MLKIVENKIPFLTMKRTLKTSRLIVWMIVIYWHSNLLSVANMMKNVITMRVNCTSQKIGD